MHGSTKKSVVQQLRHIQRLTKEINGLQQHLDKQIQPHANEIICEWHKLVNKHELLKRYPGTFRFSHLTESDMVFQTLGSGLHVELSLDLLDDSHWRSTLNKQLKQISQAEMWEALSR